MIILLDVLRSGRAILTSRRPSHLILSQKERTGNATNPTTGRRVVEIPHEEYLGFIWLPANAGWRFPASFPVCGQVSVYCISPTALAEASRNTDFALRRRSFTRVRKIVEHDRLLNLFYQRQPCTCGANDSPTRCSCPKSLSRSKPATHIHGGVEDSNCVISERTSLLARQ